jgi:hypothetical protein
VAYALLCVLAFAPGALHSRVCLVALGAIESADCCARPTCCVEEPPASPSIEAGEANCHCCVDFDLDTSERTPLSGSTANASDFEVAPAGAVCTLPAVGDPPASERARALFARAGPRPRSPAAPLPLRI